MALGAFVCHVKLSPYMSKVCECSKNKRLVCGGEFGIIGATRINTGGVDIFQCWMAMQR